MTAASTPGQFTFISNHQAPTAALLEDLFGRELKIEHEHAVPSRDGYTPTLTIVSPPNTKGSAAW
jgi:hypothetical protein